MCKIWFILVFVKDLVLVFIWFLKGHFSFYLVLVFQKNLLLVLVTKISLP